jgi:hypothetical protein
MELGIGEPDFEYVSADELRQRFNDGNYWDRARYGDLWQRLEEEGHPNPPRSGDPYCTWSQILTYRGDDARQIARVHQYKRPDGTIGGTAGKPDPKELLEGGVVYPVLEIPDAEDRRSDLETG